MTSIEIPNGVTSIGKEAFSGCSSLKEFHIRNEHPENIEIEYGAFSDLSDCTLFVPPGTGYTYRFIDWRFTVFKEVKVEE